MEPRRAGLRSGSWPASAARTRFAGDPAGILELGRVAVDLARERLAAAAEHQAGGERPGLGGEVVDLADRHARLLPDLAAHGGLDELAGLHEAGEQRVHPRRPGGGAAEEDRVAVQDQHDDDGVGTGEMLRSAGGAGALPALVGDGGSGAAAGTEAVRRVPAEDALRRRRGAGVGDGELGHHRAQVAEVEALGQAGVMVAAVVEEGAGAGGGTLPVPGSRGRTAARRRRRPRKTGGSPTAAKTGAAIGSQARCGGGPGSMSGLPCQSARQSARGSAARLASARRWAARSSAPRAKVTASASRMVPLSVGPSVGRDHAASLRRRQSRLEAASGRRYLRRPRGWRGQALRQPGQVRKEAAVTVPAWVVVQPLTSPHPGGSAHVPRPRPTAWGRSLRDAPVRTPFVEGQVIGVGTRLPARAGAEYQGTD